MDNEENQLESYNNIEYFLKQIDDYIIKDDINVIGFTVWMSNLNIIKKLSKLIKQKKHDDFIICGGPGDSKLHTLLAKDTIDIIVRG